MLKDTNYYTKLGLSQNASPEEIRSAYRKVLLKVHPDVNSKEGATELFLNIQEAYTILSNPTAKLAYDAKKIISEEEVNPVSIQPIYSCGAIRRLEEPQVVYALIDVNTKAEVNPNQETPPLNIVLLLDVSTSMKGERINTLKAAAIDFIKELGPKDLISVVAFNDHAKVIIPSRQHMESRLIRSKIQDLTAKGGTEIYQGLETGFREIRRSFESNKIHQIILITDGHTYGDEEISFNLAKQAAKLDVGISGFGIGSDWNDKFLDKLAALTGGNSVYIQKPEQIKHFLEQRIRNFAKIYAKNTLLELQVAPKITLKSAFRLLPEVSELPSSSSFLSLGALRYDATQRVLLEFLIEPIAANVDEAILANGEFIFKIGTGEHKLPLILKRSVVPADTELEATNPEILQALSRLTLYRMQEKAQLDIAQGNHKSAAKRMQDLATHLLAKEELLLGKTAIKEAAYIEEHHKFSSNGQKNIKYGTRNLLLPPSTKI